MKIGKKKAYHQFVGWVCPAKVKIEWRLHIRSTKDNLTLVPCWTRIYPAFANSIDPYQLSSEEANWSGSTLFIIQYLNLYQLSGLSNLIGWQLEMGVAS